MDWKELGWNALTAGVLAVGGLVALANSDKLQDLSEKSMDAQVKNAEKEHEKIQKEQEQIAKEI